jgi:phenylalanyl-tRNA synthetase alpha chain
MDIDVKSLHPLEIKVLLHVQAGEQLTSEKIQTELGYKLGQCNQAFSWLSAKQLIEETSRVTRIQYELTELGKSIIEIGFPGERMFKLLQEHGSLPLPRIAEILGLDKSDIGSAFGKLSKQGVFGMTAEKQAELRKKVLPRDLVLARELVLRGAEGPVDNESLTDEEREVIQTISKKRGAAGAPFRVVEREDIGYLLTEAGVEAAAVLREKQITGEELGTVTQEMLASGSWKNKTFRSYSLNAPPSRVLLGRRNPYAEYLQWVKDKLVSLGFEEFDGPLVETEFWNGDALFMPQFHSARDIHDVYYVKEPAYAREIPQPYLDQVAAAHEDGWETGSRGWGYEFDRDFTRRQVMRSQGTVLSAKQLPKARIPGKYFGIARCFRYDQVDATHGADFYQTEGIVLGEDVNLRTLLGLLKMFAEEVAGAEEVKYVPGYFPFTEPSIEVHIKHPVLGWFELGGSGIFRPEVTQALGIDVPVLAWGLGIDRMALMHLGLNDLRDLFTPDIESVRMRRGK